MPRRFDCVHGSHARTAVIPLASAAEIDPILFAWLDRDGVLATDELGVYQSRLSDGWWAMGRDGAAQRRWMDGGVVLLLPPFDGPTMLEIRASNGGMIYVVAAEADGGRAREFA